MPNGKFEKGPRPEESPEEKEEDREIEDDSGAEEKDSPEVKERIAKMPDSLREFFGKLDLTTRRIICSDEGLLERSNEELSKHFDRLMKEIEDKGMKPLLDRFMEESEK